MSSMSDYYYINRLTNIAGKHDIHSGWCKDIPCIIYRECLGLFDTPRDAESEAIKRGFENVVTCSCHNCQNP